MTTAAGTEGQRRDLLSRIIGLVLTVLFGASFVLLAWMALSSRFGWTSGDPHGYGMIFGTFLALITGILVAIAVPLMFPRARRGTAYLWSLIGYLAVAVGLIVALVTA
ncbi:hypothetical protein ACIP5T_14990 [Microbacterium sp. NPDC088619]|uniref:hypothetical protein n=1 Tax=Microbacterium sp. NPDC088619 TaxID=3364196 RepID=UPI003808EF37